MRKITDSSHAKISPILFIENKICSGGMSTDRPYTAVPSRVFVLKVMNRGGV